MSASRQKQYEVRATLPATLDSIEEFVRRTRAIWREQGSRNDGFVNELLLRELLTNAVLHGCGGDASKVVRCALRLKPHRFFLLVSDEGGGFDWRAAWQRHSDLTDCRGRGMEILQEYAKRIRFGGLGNKVAVSRDFE